ncbi:MAG: hypothetical protein AAGF73_08935 [Actinomycetota bacterium]
MKTVGPSSALTADDLNDYIARLEAIRDSAIERKRHRSEQPTLSLADRYPNDPAGETHRQIGECLKEIDRHLDQRCDVQIQLAESLIAAARNRLADQRSHLKVVN